MARTTSKIRRKGSVSLKGFSSAEESLVGLDHYLNDVSREGRISPEREIELGRRAQAGDESAVEELVRANLRFVISIAKKYQNRGISLPDLIQEGNAGLVRAARKFDPDQGVKFISYAVWWIRQAIMVALANQGRAVRIPLNRATDLHRIRKEQARLREKLQREPTVTEIAEVAGIRAEVINTLLQISSGEVRLDAAILDDGDRSLVERFVQDDAVYADRPLEEKSITDRVHTALQDLPARDAKILRMYYGFDGDDALTLEEIGSMIGVTRERVRQLRNRALRRLKEGEHGTALESLAF